MSEAPRSVAAVGRRAITGADAFPNVLRARPEILRLAPEGSENTVILRVQAAEAWDAVRVECQRDTSVVAVKQAAMAILLPDVAEHEQYVVKLRGAEIRNERVTLQQAGVLPGSTLLVMSRRRRPLR